MKKYLSIPVFLFVLLLGFSIPNQEVKAQLSVGCPAPLQLKLGPGGISCSRVYLNTSDLLPGCPDLDYANNYRSIECQPQAGYSIAIPGTFNVDGSFTSIAPLGWIATNGGWAWNGGIGPFSASYPYPLPNPGGPTPDQVNECQAVQSLASGAPVYSGIAEVVTISARDACIEYSALQSCGISTLSLPAIFDSNFNYNTCSQYGLTVSAPNSGGTTGTGTGTDTGTGSGSGTGTGGSTTGTGTVPTGGNSTIITSQNLSYNNLYAQIAYLSNLLNQLSTSISGGTTADNSSFTDSSLFVQNMIERARLAQLGILSGSNTISTGSGSTAVATDGSISGSVVVTVAHLNVRTTPSSAGTLVRQAKLGDSIIIVSAITGESVEGVNRWWKMSDGNYIWSGGTTFPSLTTTSGTGGTGTTGGSNITPFSTKFATGQRVVTTSNLNVRSMGSTAGALLGTQSIGATGTVVGGGTDADGYYWWNINYDTGVSGWSVEQYLVTENLRR